jgi:phosphoribosylamine--glycine ligase
MLDARDSVVSSAPASSRRSAKNKATIKANTQAKTRGASSKASSSSSRKLPLQRVFSDAKVKPFDQIEWDRRTALGVVLAAHGYPDEPRRGDLIEGVGPRAAVADDCLVFHAGTALLDGNLVTAGGRVLCVTALADSVKQAQQKAYQEAIPIAFEGMQMRQDIGYRAIKN